MIEVVAAVVCKDDRFLLCQRPIEKEHGGLWEFPGGKVAPGETLEEAIQRELLEELGAQGSVVLGEMGRYLSGDARYLIIFLRVELQQNPTSREHAALGWFSRHQIADLSLPPADRNFFENAL